MSGLAHSSTDEMTESFELDELLNRYAAGSCTREEFERMMFLITNADTAEPPAAHWQRSWESVHTPPEISPEWRKRFDAMLKDSLEAEPVRMMPENKTNLRPRKWLITAAAAVCLLTISLMRFFKSEHAAENHPTALATEKKSSGHERATLTLSDGRQIGLDTATTGRIAMQSGVKISKTDQGEVIYYLEPASGISPGYNKIAVPPSGDYSIVLSDGTRVHLNAASTLRFPVAFTGDTREVSLTGEAYFEVKKNPSRPFHVKTGGFTVEVFGTRFNVKSYPEDGSSAATLVEGKVRIQKQVNGRSAGFFLKPGQQAALNAAGKLRLNSSPNLDEVLAWQSDNFKFANRPVLSFLHDVARWYDVPVVYRGSPPVQQLTGTFPRKTDLSQLVAMLRYAGVKVNIAPNHSLVVGE